MRSPSENDQSYNLLDLGLWLSSILYVIKDLHWSYCRNSDPLTDSVSARAPCTYCRRASIQLRMGMVKTISTWIPDWILQPHCMRQAGFRTPSLTAFFAIFLLLVLFLLPLMLQRNQKQRGHDQEQKASGFHSFNYYLLSIFFINRRKSERSILSPKTKESLIMEGKPWEETNEELLRACNDYCDKGRAIPRNSWACIWSLTSLAKALRRLWEQLQLGYLCVNWWLQECLARTGESQEHLMTEPWVWKKWWTPIWRTSFPGLKFGGFQLFPLCSRANKKWLSLCFQNTHCK